MGDSVNRYVWTSKVGAKGQIIIPKEARKLFDINPGDTVMLLGSEGQGIAIPKNDPLDDMIDLVFKRGGTYEDT